MTIVTLVSFLTPSTVVVGTRWWSHKSCYNYQYLTGRSLGQGGGRSTLALSGTLLLDPSFSYPQAVETWCGGREGRELVIKLH